MIRWMVLPLLLLSFSASAYDAPMHPNPEVTTGDYCDEQDSHFEGYRYREKVATCYREVSKERKAKIYEMYGVPKRCRKQYTVDHFVPLSMGGSNAVENLWPEHKDIKATRQNMEQELYNQLENGEISVRTALQRIRHAKMNPPHVDPRECLAN